MTIGHCSQEGCKGHLGKFPTCLTEALWEWTMLGAGDSTGSVEAYGHYTLIHVDEATDHDIGEYLGVEDHGPVVPVPVGWYMVIVNDQGAVDHVEYADEASAMEVFTAVERDYSAWLDVNEPDEWDIAPNAGSSE